jgi:hypothetical protein
MRAASAISYEAHLKGTVVNPVQKEWNHRFLEHVYYNAAFCP